VEQTRAENIKDKEIECINFLYQWGDLIFDSELGASLSNDDKSIIWNKIQKIYTREILIVPDTDHNHKANTSIDL